MQLTADPAYHPFPAVLPGQQAVIFAEHVRRTHDAGAGHDFAEHFLALGLFLEGKSRGYLGASPLRTMLEVLLQSRHVEETRLAQLVADSGEALGEVDVDVLESGEKEEETKEYV